MLGQGSYTRTEGAAPGSVHPRFFIEAVQDELASSHAGRPIFREEERVEILMPGIANLTRPVFRVNDEYRQRWPREYEAFQQGREIAPDGTPLEEWPILNRAQVLELKALHIRTVEDIANLSDVAGQRIGMGWMSLRDRAKAFLDDAERSAYGEKLQAQHDAVQAENAALRNQVEELDKLTRQLHADVMQMRNAPNAIATAIPGMSDPMQVAAAMEAAASRDTPQSSLAAFANDRKSRRAKEAA